MGKKSKKANKIKDSSRKERLQERRERTLDAAANPPEPSINNDQYQHPNNDSSSGYDRPYFVGDRVWFVDTRSDGENSHTYRGVIQEVDADRGMLGIVSLQNLIAERNEVWRIRMQDVFPDFCDLTLRFNIGDHVLCRCGPWLPKVVAYHWPIYEIEESMGGSFSNVRGPRDIVPHYKCGPVAQKGGYVAAPSDDDSNIREHPTAFRFSVGESVTLNLELAYVPRSASNNKRNVPLTICEGTVTQIDITEKFNDYFAYECQCSLGAQEQFKCYIPHDDDQHIARKGADPRERLFEAISQDCYFSHLSYLVSTYAIDVSMFLDLVVDKAFEHGSYYTFLWLQEDFKYDIHTKVDSTGDNFLHRIAKSANASRFIEKLTSHIDDDPKLDVNGITGLRRKEVITNATNSDGQTWLEILINRGDVRALDLALSPRRKFSWSTCIYRCGKIDPFMNCVEQRGDQIIKLIVSSSEFRQRMKMMYDSIHMCYVESEEKLLGEDRMSPLCGPDAALNAKQLIRFINDWKNHTDLDYNIFHKIVKMGFSKLFGLFYPIAKNSFWGGEHFIDLNDDHNQFIQPEISSNTEREGIWADLMTVCIIGQCKTLYRHDFYEKHKYFRTIRKHFQSPESSGFVALVSHLKTETNSKRYDMYNDLIKYKISLFEDSQSLNGRLKILSSIVRDRPDAKIDVLLVIRNRQCGVLRWIVEQNLIDLDLDVKRAKLSLDDFRFIKDLPEMSLGTFICFAAVEYDDLFSLQWLCDQIGCPRIRCHGMNILHLASLFGRLEIVGWLHTCQTWSFLVNEPCVSIELNGLYAAHVAAGQGHIQVAELLLKLGCKRVDNSEKQPEYYAKRAPIVACASVPRDYEFAHGWAMERNGEICFDQEHTDDIMKLFELLENGTSIDVLKDHILLTGILDVERWVNSGCETFDQHIQGHWSYGDILEKCFTFEDAIFADWLILFLRLEVSDRYDYFWKETGHYNEIDKRSMHKDDLLLAAREREQHDIANILSHHLIRDVYIFDPKEESPFSLPSLQSRKNLLARLQSKLIEVRTLIAIVESVRQHGVASAINAGNTIELMEMIRIYKYVRNVLRAIGMLNCDMTECYSCLHRIEANENLLEMNTSMPRFGLKCAEGLQKYCFIPSHDQSRLYIRVVIESQAEIVHFCMNNIGGWTSDIEKDMILSASFLGYSDIVNLLLHDSDLYSFCSDFGSRHYQATLGACIAGRYFDLQKLGGEFNRRLDDPIISLSETDFIASLEDVSACSLISQSLLASTVRSFITDAHSDLQIISFLVHKWKYTNHDVMHSLELAILSIKYSEGECQCVLRLLELYNFLSREFSLRPVNHQFQLRGLAGMVIEIVPRIPTNFHELIFKWVESLIIYVDIQDLSIKSLYNLLSEEDDFPLSNLKEKQRNYWAQFDAIKKGQSLADVQQSIQNGHLSTTGYDRGGLQLIHLAASYERIDVLKWLVMEKNIGLQTLDGDGRTLQQIAEAAKATNVLKWIETYKAESTITSFIFRNVRRIQSIQQHRRIIRYAILIQKMTRGYLTHKLYYKTLCIRLEESQHFQVIWSQSISRLGNLALGLHSWEAVRSTSRDISNAEVVDSATTNKLDEALSNVVLDDNNENFLAEESEFINANETETHPIRLHDNAFNDTKWSDSFRVTSHVVKFLKSGDPLYRSFFVRRMRQLANGDRSKILQKRLKGSKSAIYETYLEQKSGFRILWTEEGETIVVWFVAKHKSVSRLMQMIDDAKSRSSRQQIPDHLVEHPNRSRESKEILLDIGNAPLKVYDVNFYELDDITKASWTPQLHLTDEEKKVVEANGTVLLLGRSGTGKTLCICNRMELDRRKFDHDPSFTQLFVSRSSRLCKYVKEVVGDGPGSCSRSFSTFNELIHQTESLVSGVKKNRSFIRSEHVDFYRFAREFYDESQRDMGKLSALLVWKTIQTFLKGSIEAYQAPNHILKKDFFISGSLGKNRCRLRPDHREQVYSIFLDYEKYLESGGLWDDCDRVVSLLARIKKSKSADPLCYDKIRKGKIYVDEIQDYTQVECLLFFYIGGPGGLFLAGDPAQSVVEGSDFRFEDVRSVGYFVAGQDRRDLIPQKPKTVNVNFRSHSGILNTAAAVLDHLFTHFPASATQLKRDHGLFQGPRPGVCYNVGYKKSLSLFKGQLKGIIVLTHDESASRWKRVLDYPLVYGIRESKGLEFKSVLILDFFCELPSVLQKPWRDMILNRTDIDFSSHNPLIENTLKLLYTAITRSIEQLHFVETSKSVAGDAMVRWLTTTTIPGHGNEHDRVALGTKRNISNLESITMTSDEWIASGIDHAEMAQAGEIEFKHALSLLDRSVYCFEQAQVVDLAAKARAHRQSVQLRYEVSTRQASSGIATLESKVAQLFDILLTENLLEEAIHLIKTVLSYVSPYTKEQLERQVLQKLHYHTTT